MHNLYFGCRTCHVRPAEGKKALTYFWYKRSTGEVVPNPQIGDAPIDSLDIKLTPCDNCDKAPDSKEIEKSGRSSVHCFKAWRRRVSARSRRRKSLSRFIKVLPSSPLYAMNATTKKASLFPAGGWISKRAGCHGGKRRNTKMINEYEVFHKPKFIEPDKWTVK